MYKEVANVSRESDAFSQIKSQWIVYGDGFGVLSANDSQMRITFASSWHLPQRLWRVVLRVAGCLAKSANALGTTSSKLDRGQRAAFALGTR